MKPVSLAALALAIPALASPESYHPLKNNPEYPPNSNYDFSANDNHGYTANTVPKNMPINLPDQTLKPEEATPTPIPTPTSTTTPTTTPTPTLTPTTTSTSSYDYSYEINLTGFNGKITHYYISYSDPWISGGVGVGSVAPKPTTAPSPGTQGVICDRNFPGLLAALGLDLGLRLNLSFVGVNACVAL